jgi:hypothetical protein
VFLIYVRFGLGLDGIGSVLIERVDNLCRSYMGSSNERPFLELALESGRALLAKSQFERVREALHSLAGNAVVEIGPGVGHCAFFAHCAGIDYTTIDLPLGVVAQACFLGCAAGPGNIWMDGDRESLPPSRSSCFPSPNCPNATLTLHSMSTR